MNELIMSALTQAGVITVELLVGFGLFWIGQFAYQKLFRRRMELNVELFVKDNPAVAIALVSYYFGMFMCPGFSHLCLSLNY
ncbi:MULTISPECIES: DUF350 domain-containing protein [unclassified Anabaena]|uniref:DUF350 domain-containing protein n=1 Tax=unclassified Anabaena TaxID=2619674 RepID=UPI001C2CA5A8|nr:MULTISPECIES: hypothetical protein [unclassified Anabaena]